MPRQRDSETGRLGEDIAVDYLKSAGFRIVERNFRCRLGEIDIIARGADGLYFVEVKARRDDRFGSPLESITLNKQAQIVKTARYFLMDQGEDIPCHFGVVSIVIDGSRALDIKFIPDAFETG